MAAVPPPSTEAAPPTTATAATSTALIEAQPQPSTTALSTNPHRAQLLGLLSSETLADVSFLSRYEQAESRLDGVDKQHTAEVGERLLSLRAAIERGGEAAGRVERRMGLLVRHAANAWAHLQIEQLRVERDAQAMADRREKKKKGAGKQKATQATAEAEAEVAALMAETQQGWKERLERLSGTISAPLSLSDEPGRLRDLNVCGSARDDCYNQSAEVKATARHAYGEHADVRRRTRSASLIQLSYQVVLRFMGTLPLATIVGSDARGCELLELLVRERAAHVLRHVLLNIAMGASMHDVEAAFSAGLAAANGVDGGGWDTDRREAWLVEEYALLDTCWNGIDEEHEKPKIAQASGYLEFFDMEAAQVELLIGLMEDLPAFEWRLRWDVVSPGFLLTWARVLRRYAPPALGLGLSEQKQLGRRHDYFSACHRLIIALLNTSWEGGFDEKDANKGLTGAALVLTAVVEPGRSIRFVECAVELPPEEHRNFAGLSGSHLPKGLILYALTGESYPCSAAVAEQAKKAIGCRRAAAETALRAMVAGSSAEAVGARSIGLADELCGNDALCFHEWRVHAGIHLTLLPEGELRPGFEKATKARLAAPRPKWPMLRKLCPHVVERLAPAGVRHPAAAMPPVLMPPPQLAAPSIGDVSGVPQLEKRKLGKVDQHVHEELRLTRARTVEEARSGRTRTRRG